MNSDAPKAGITVPVPLGVLEVMVNLFLNKVKGRELRRLRQWKQIPPRVICVTGLPTTGTRIPDPPFSSFGPSRDYGMDLCLEVFL